MTPAPLTHAEKARAAHRALRLSENGIRSEKQLRQLAGRAMADEQDQETGGLDQAIGSSTQHPLARTAYGLYAYTDEEITDYPTDPNFVEYLMNMGDLTSIWKVWDDAVTGNLEQTLPSKQLREWRASVERDRKAFEERVQLLDDTGDSSAVHPIFGHGRAQAGAANAMYDLGREGFADGTIIWTATPTHKILLVDSADYAVNLATHQFVSSIASVGIVATTAALTTKTKALGVCDADDTVFTAASGDQSEAMVIAQTSAVGGGADVATTAQRLIGYIDTATGLPVTPNTGNINVTWDNGANRIFKL
jgi:hypothetical protein